MLVDADDYFLTSPLYRGPSHSFTRVMLPEDRSWFPRKQIFALSFGRENGVVAHRPEHSFCQSFPSGRKEKKSSDLVSSENKSIRFNRERENLRRLPFLLADKINT